MHKANQYDFYRQQPLSAGAAGAAGAASDVADCIIQLGSNAVCRVHINTADVIDPRGTITAAVAVIRERAAQDLKWGQSNHPDLPAGVKHPCAFFGIPTADAARLFCETAFRTGTGSNAHILLEEVSEAIEAADDPVHLRAELVQVAAVALKWIEQIDRRPAALPAEVRHG